MNGKIAILMKDPGSAASFFDADKISIFEKNDCGWELMSELSFPSDIKTEPSELRAATLRLIEDMGDCRVIAGAKISGVPYTELDRCGFSIFEIEDYGPGLFEAIAEDMENAGAEMSLNEKMISDARPIETSTPGVYYLDLVALQAERPEVSSKRAMKEFFETTPFVELHLVCGHIPQWLEDLPLDISKSETADGKIKAVISRKRCG